ncbi:hypothetical protein FRX31_022054 [Thalictrum thalictroides]|uniref:Uncharacterized protein n=1 Tax=Thalictrum thalictroides TaxID=46969 RepID=A0A7J6VW18_THATH|nr:hypothetical protein FRX31_022054 [Thalictrum thalictroides]
MRTILVAYDVNHQGIVMRQANLLEVIFGENESIISNNLWYYTSFMRKLSYYPSALLAFVIELISKVGLSFSEKVIEVTFIFQLVGIYCDNPQWRGD